MSSAKRAVVVCPGRGQYRTDELWPLKRLGAVDGEAFADAVAALDRARAERGAPPLIEVAADRPGGAAADFAPDVTSALIFAAGAADLALVEAAVAAGALEVVAVCGLSLGFYTALHAAGALSLADAARLVDTMGAIQVAQGPVGGQIVHPAVADEDWRPDPAREAAIDRALAAASAAPGSCAARSIRLGGYEVLAGDEPGLAALVRALPPETRKGVSYPVRLPGHSAFHTRLMAPMAEAARERLADLEWHAPRRRLIDGRGAAFRVLSTDPGALFDYTLGAQVVETYDFGLSLRVALRETAPDAIVAIGPGDTLGGPIGQVLVRERYAGVADRAAFAARQAGPEPILRSLGRAGERERLASGSAAATSPAAAVNFGQ